MTYLLKFDKPGYDSRFHKSKIKYKVYFQGSFDGYCNLHNLWHSFSSILLCTILIIVLMDFRIIPIRKEYLWAMLSSWMANITIPNSKYDWQIAGQERSRFCHLLFWWLGIKQILLYFFSQCNTKTNIILDCQSKIMKVT